MTVAQLQVPSEEAPPVDPAALQQQQQQPQQQQASPQGERPAWLPEKFKSPEDLARAYAELEKKLGQGGGQQQPQQKQQQQQPAQAPSREEFHSRAEKAGIDLAPFYDEYLANGALSEQSYAKLAEKGLSKDFVDAFIAGQEAIAAQLRNEVYELVGGEQAFAAMMEWAKANMSDAEKAAFNREIDRADPATAKLMVQGLHARYTAAVGRDPKLVGGEQSRASGYRSMAEYLDDIKNPRYERDEAFRADVMRKLQASNIF